MRATRHGHILLMMNDTLSCLMNHINDFVRFKRPPQAEVSLAEMVSWFSVTMFSHCSNMEVTLDHFKSKVASVLSWDRLRFITSNVKAYDVTSRRWRCRSVAFATRPHCLPGRF
uniref:Uncharacterized protein n=1 Tax=Spongospora subterranea TaxID=70186 RepID=A0A0H5QXC6_9EUKA|eukprot:CRZ06377.1 hypothetical protein [Spongospora subterranea]